MSLHDELNEIVSADRSVSPAKRRSRVPYPQGWEPRVTDISSTEAEAISDVITKDADDIALIEGWNLDPAIWSIVDGTLKANRWMMNGEWQYQYKATLVKVTAASPANVDELFKVVKNHKKFTPPTGDEAFVITLSDWQIGKGENGGTEATVERILNSFDAAESRIKKLRKLGHEIGEIYLVGMGDLIEKCANNYADQPFTTDLNEREQARIARRLLLEITKRAAKLASKVVIASVGGNHGENRNGSSKQFTDDGDNLDVGLFETVYEALAMNEAAFSHVYFCLPNDELSLALDIAGTNIGFAHGHKGKKGATPQQKAFNWWMGQEFGNHAVAGADVLVTAHYHHFAACEQFGRLWLQCPAQDGGSKWYTDATGAWSKAGMLTFVVGPEGVREIQVV